MERRAMKMIELTALKAGTVWVNPGQVIYIAPPDGMGSSMYGDNNQRAGSKLFFAQGSSLEVRESPTEVVSRMAD